MTDRFPLIFDTTDKKIKEIPSGDNLSLIGSDITGVSAISSNTITAGSLNTDSLLVDGQPLGAVALSNNYDDLDNTPVGFSGSYDDLRNLPSIPSATRQLSDVEDQEPNDNDILQYDSADGKFIPVPLDIDLSQSTIGDLGNVIITGTITNKFLKFTAGAWRPTTIQYGEVQNTPTSLSAFANDVGYLTSTSDLVGSVFGDDSTLLVDGVNSLINLKDTIDDDVIPKEASAVDLGSPEKPFRSLYLSDNTLILGDYALGINNGKLKLTNPGVDSGAEGFEVLDIFAEFVGVQQGLIVDNNATMNLGSFIQFEEIEQFGTDIGKLGTFADSFIGFTQAGGMILYTGAGVPATSIGDPGTPIGAIAIDSNYIYYCVAEYDGVTDIWRRTPWAESSW